MKKVQPGIFSKNNRIYTRNQVPGEAVYGEALLNHDDQEYRRWVAKRSKAGAAVMNGIDLGLRPGHDVLYLGAASGTTVSHFSDILEDGKIYAVEYSDTVARDLLSLAEVRDNIVPILGDARKPEDYESFLRKADVVFQDISQRDQAEIFLKNVEKFLADDGVALLAVKARSISSSDPVEEIFDDVKEKLEEELSIVEETELDPYETEHLFLKMKK